jgi:hypothetical protein
MFHLGSSKVTAALKKMYLWPSLAADTKRWLADCPDCELEKARQNTAHGTFSARPFDAPRARCAMDFQGQGLAITGETEALAVIDTTPRYVTVLCLKDREATMAGLGLSDQKNAARCDHAHRDRRGLFSIHTKYGLLNRLPTKVSFSIFD